LRQLSIGDPQKRAATLEREIRGDQGGPRPPGVAADPPESI